MKLVVCLFALAIASTSFAATTRNATVTESNLFCRAIEAQYRSFNLEMGIDVPACRAVAKRTQISAKGTRTIKGDIQVYIEGDNFKFACAVPYTGKPIFTNVVFDTRSSFCKNLE